MQLRQKAYLLAMLNGFRGKRSEMKSEDHLTLIEELGDLDERPKKYNRARVLLGSSVIQGFSISINSNLKSVDSNSTLAVYLGFNLRIFL